MIGIKPDISQAIAVLCPEGVWAITEEDYDRIDWQSPDVEQPSKSAIQAKLAELQAEYDAKQYQRDRQYPSIPDQLDKIYHSGINEWKKDIKAVKDKYPKP